ncbi:MAG: ATP-dependent metallopeptidase FtsH/Yme1/Tma family protein [Vampirovibrionales bacterium]|jgi:ATP-dependent metalloprotease FtsH|nr:ATP-dependent metallopeptidase FtsH/Yme1/Tma family protein [Vampirovibrionales bacterium]
MNLQTLQVNSLYHRIHQQKSISPVATPPKKDVSSLPPTVLNASIAQPIQVQIVPSARKDQGKSQVNWASWAFLGVFAGVMTASMWLPWVKSKLSKSTNIVLSDHFQLIKETGVKFSDVLGADESKKSMMDILDFIKNPKKYEDQGAVMPKGVLLKGPPGTGKTMLAKALAGEAGVPFLSTSGSDFNEKYVGVGSARVRALFHAAHSLAKQEKSPVIIYIDEIDALIRSRGHVENSTDETVNQFLSCMDGIQTSEHPIIVTASTNADLPNLDPAAIRAGRLGRHVEVALPDLKGRQALFEHYGKKYTLSEASKAHLNTLAKNSMGFSPADIKNILNEAAILTARDNHKNITPALLDEAVARVLMGSKRDLKMPQSEKEKTAYHEIGHAIVGHFLERDQEIKKVSIVPRDKALGVTSSQPNHDYDVVSKSKEDYLNEMAMAFGGPIAEEQIYGLNNVTSRAYSDLDHIRKIALAMVEEFGFGKGIPPRSYIDSEKSEHLKQRLEKAVDEIVTQAEQRAREVLKKQSHLLNKATEALLKEEMLDAPAFKKLVNQYGVPMSTGKRSKRVV